jgi:hypothetical protein
VFIIAFCCLKKLPNLLFKCLLQYFKGIVTFYSFFFRKIRFYSVTSTSYELQLVEPIENSIFS